MSPTTSNPLSSRSQFSAGIVTLTTIHLLKSTRGGGCPSPTASHRSPNSCVLPAERRCPAASGPASKTSTTSNGIADGTVVTGDDVVSLDAAGGAAIGAVLPHPATPRHARANAPMT